MYLANAARSWVIKRRKKLALDTMRFGVNVVPLFFVCKAEFVQILGIVKSKKKSDNPEIVKLSETVKCRKLINSSVSLAKHKTPKTKECEINPPSYKTERRKNS